MIRTMMIATMAVTMMSGAALAGSCGGSSHSHDVKTSAVESTPDIVDTAIAAGSFNTLVTAVEAAELVEVLKGEGPFTVFAPTDEAFAALPEGLKQTTSPSTLFQMFLLWTYHVAMMDRKSFGQIGTENMHYLRLSIATGMEDLKLGMERMAKAVEDEAGFALFIEKQEHFS